jgi:hypothetical protein
MNVSLTGNVAISDLSNSSAVAFAATALRGDLRARLGFENGAAGCIELRVKAPSGAFDSHTVEVLADRIVITGSDDLGLIHGIYAFSEKWLGSDPCRWFTGIVPELASKVEIPLGRYESEPYTFRHRGWFVNDEDLLVGFQMEKPEHGFSMEVWQALLECALRLQCTCIIPGTNILSDEPQIKLASDMGLYIAQHHAEPVGSAPFFWPRGVPFSWSTHRADMLRWWRKAIERQSGKKVLWTLNFRGLLDRPFWVDDPHLKPDAPLEAKAQIINEALAAQYDLIREIRGEQQPEVFGYLWGELYNLYCAGLLRFPKGTTIIHTDGGNGCMAGNMEELVCKSASRTGVYQHISMFTGALSVRVTSYSPRTYARELKRAVESGMTEIFILNVGNVREKIFNLRQVMGYANDYAAMAAISGPDGEGYFDWYAQHVLHARDTRIGQTYRDLTEIPFRLQDDNPDSKFGDNIYTNIVRYSLQRLYNRENQPPSIYGLGALKTFDEAMDWFIDKLGRAAPQWEIAAARAADQTRHLEGAALRFYECDGLAQVEKAMHLNAMALHFCRSAKQYLSGKGYPAYLEAYQALRHCDAALAVEKRIETGQFAGWHRNDLNCRTKKCHEFLGGWHTMLDHQRWMNLEGMAEGPQPCYAAYKYNPNFETAYRPDLFLQPER